MMTEINNSFKLTLEIEGLLSLLITREGLPQPQIMELLNEKIDILHNSIKELSVHKYTNPQTEPTPLDEPAPTAVDTVCQNSGMSFVDFISENDKFLLQKSLFNDSEQLMNDALLSIERTIALDDAVDIIENDFCIDITSSEGIRLVQLLKLYLDN